MPKRLNNTTVHIKTSIKIKFSHKIVSHTQKALSLAYSKYEKNDGSYEGADSID